jgi:hypothetical protein
MILKAESAEYEKLAAVSKEVAKAVGHLVSTVVSDARGEPRQVQQT